MTKVVQGCTRNRTMNMKNLSFDNNIKHRKAKKFILSGSFGDSTGE